jgi:hypothetical protein
LQRSPVFLGDPADLRGKKIDRFEQVVERFLMLRHGFFEVSQRFVTQRSQARGHQEHRLTLLLVDRHFAGYNHLVAGQDSRVGDADKAIR